jgi:hypothetical protein
MTRTSAIARAIARHEAAQAAYDVAAAASAASPDDMNADDIANDLCKAESDVYYELVAMPCATNAEFIEKLKVLIDLETRLFGSPFDSIEEFAPVARAVALHFEPAP